MSRLKRVSVVLATCAILFSVSAPAYANHGNSDPPGNACGHTYPPPPGCPPNSGPKPQSVDMTPITDDDGLPMGLVLGAGALGAAGLVLGRRRARRLH